MSNVQEKMYDLDRMYNPDIKEQFLETQYSNETDTKRTVAYVFYKSAKIEEQLGYDLANFSRDEIGNVLKRFNSMTIEILRGNSKYIEKYITWAIKKGIRINNIHPLKKITDEYLEKYYFPKKLYMSEEEVIELEDKLINPQDQAIIRCLFEGISGHELSELYNLKVSDIDWNNNIIHLKDDRYGEREIKVSDRCLRFIRWANEQTKYQKTNGNSTAKSPIMQLIESEYVFKNVKTNVDKENDHVDLNTFYRKLKQISRWFSIPYLKPKNVSKSGQISMAVNLYKNEGKLTNRQLEKIAKQFGLRKMNQNGYEMYNYFVMRQTINPENIKELYDIDITE